MLISRLFTVLLLVIPSVVFAAQESSSGSMSNSEALGNSTQNSRALDSRTPNDEVLGTSNPRNQNNTHNTVPHRPGQTIQPGPSDHPAPVLDSAGQ